MHGKLGFVDFVGGLVNDDEYKGNVMCVDSAEHQGFVAQLRKLASNSGMPKGWT